MFTHGFMWMAGKMIFEIVNARKRPSHHPIVSSKVKNNKIIVHEMHEFDVSSKFFGGQGYTHTHTHTFFNKTDIPPGV